VLPVAEWKIEDTISHDTVTGRKRVRTVIAVWPEGVIGIAAETGVSDVQTRRLLIEEGIGQTEGKTLCLALDLCLERGSKTVANVAEAGDVPQATEMIRQVIQSRHRPESVYHVDNLAQLLQVTAKIANGLILMVLAIALLVLVVSGVGVSPVLQNGTLTLQSKDCIPSGGGKRSGFAVGGCSLCDALDASGNPQPDPNDPLDPNKHLQLPCRNSTKAGQADCTERSYG